MNLIPLRVRLWFRRRANYLIALNWARHLERQNLKLHWENQDLNSQLCRDHMKRIGIEEGHRWGQA